MLNPTIKKVATLILKKGRLATLAMALAALGLGLSAVTLASVLRLDACHLCIFQRLAFFVIGALLIFAFLGWENRLARRTLLIVASAGCAWGMNVAAQQSWLQWFPESGFNCTMSETGMTERLIDWLGELFPAFFMATGFCGSKDLVIAGLSLANWSFVIFTLFLTSCLSLAVFGKEHGNALPNDDQATE